MSKAPQLDTTGQIANLLATMFAGASIGASQMLQARADASSSRLLSQMPDVEAALYEEGEYVSRADSAIASPTPYTRDDLVSLLTSMVKRTRYAKNVAEQLFPTDTSIAKPGHTSYRCFRLDESGEPTPVGNSGRATNVNSAQLTQTYQDFPIEYYQLNAEWTWLEEMASANLDTIINARAEQLRAADRICKRFRSRWWWLAGLDGNGAMGILANPWISKLYLPTTVSGSPSDSEVQSIYDDIVRLINYPIEVLEGHEGLEPNTLALSPRMKARLGGLTFGDNKDHTVLSRLVQNTGIERVISVPYLTDPEGDGQDVLMVFPSDPQADPQMDPEGIMDSVIRLPVPIDVMPLEEVRTAGGAVVPHVFGLGSVMVEEPLSMAIGYMSFSRR